MMRRSLCFLLLLALTACIEVDDLGSYKDKGTIDSQLLGTWELKKHTRAETVAVSEEGGRYRMELVHTQKQDSEGDKPIFARTLQVQQGNAFLVIFEGAKSGGNMVRYVLSGDVLTLYRLNPLALQALLAKKYPGQKNITVEEGESGFAKVKLLDDETLRILSQIPEGETYWTAVSRYEKVRR